LHISLQNCRSYKIVVLRGYIQAAREVLINIGEMAPSLRCGYFPYNFVGKIYNKKLLVIIFPYKSIGFKLAYF
jgi:hypothetical protein